MIKKLKLINFQIHKKITIEFDEKFNVIVGHNNKGKSSIIRALYWTFYNEPVGDWMRRIEDGEMLETLVKITFFNGDVVKRIKGTGLNKYVVNDEEFENFGYGVPQRVKEVLNVHQFKTNKFEFPLNIFMQDDQPFLIHETGPVKASVIDVLTGVSLLQKSITEFNKERLESTKQCNQLIDQIEEDKGQLESLPDLKKAQTIVDEAQEIQEQLNEVELDKNNLNILKDKYKFAIELIEKVDSQYVDITTLIKLKERLEDYDSNLMILKKLRFKLKQANETMVLPNVDLEKITDLILKIQKIKDRYEYLKKQRSKLNDSEIELDIVDVHLPLAEKELKDLWKELGICPLCGVKQ
jgi:DNA repair exonuclease SbcCD ATPase subunit